MIGILVVVTQQALARRHALAAARAARLSEFAETVWAATMALGLIARALGDEKAAVQERERLAGVKDRFNTVMAQIQLLEAQDVLLAAVMIDWLLVRLTVVAVSETFSSQEGDTAREPLTQAVRDFLSTARKALGSSRLPRDVLAAAVPTGRTAETESPAG